MKDNSHHKRTFIDWFARHCYCQRARLNSIRFDKRFAKRAERRYQKSLCTEARENL